MNAEMKSDPIPQPASGSHPVGYRAPNPNREGKAGGWHDAFLAGQSDRRHVKEKSKSSNRDTELLDALDHKEADLQSEMDYDDIAKAPCPPRGRVNRMALRALYLIGEHCSTKFVVAGSGVGQVFNVRVSVEHAATD